MISVIVGLGNPGHEYEDTRHNIGFDVVDFIARRQDAYWNLDSKFDAYIARSNFGAVEGPGLPVWFIKPQTYMNLSGESIQAFFRWHKLGPSSLLVVLDDVALPLGRLRIRPGGSHGGHNGLASIEERIGRQQFARLRCGVGPKPERLDLAKWVLGKFTLTEGPQVDRMIERAADAVKCAILHGVDVAMNEFNSEPKQVS